jgi:hypothetical protein
MHRVLIGQHAESSWFADCADCAWTYEGTSPSIMVNAARQHGQIVPGGYMPRAFVEALVLGVMSPPAPADHQAAGSSTP